MCLIVKVQYEDGTRRQVPEGELDGLLLCNNGGAPGSQESKQIAKANGEVLRTPAPAPVPTAPPAQALAPVYGLDTRPPASPDEKDLQEESCVVAPGGMQAVTPEGGTGSRLVLAAVPAVGKLVGGGDVPKIKGVEVAVAVAASDAGSLQDDAGGRAGSAGGRETGEMLGVETSAGLAGAGDADGDSVETVEAASIAATEKRATKMKEEAQVAAEKAAAKQAEADALRQKADAVQAEADALHDQAKAKAEAALASQA